MFAELGSRGELLDRLLTGDGLGKRGRMEQGVGERSLAKAGACGRKVFKERVRAEDVQVAIVEMVRFPEGLAVLRARLKAEGYKSFPKSYQVVVRCASNDTLLLSTNYAAHRVIAK